MTPPRRQNGQSEKASEEALHWLIAMQDAQANEGADDGLQARFADWLAEDPSHAAAWQEACKVAGLIDQSLPQLEPCEDRAAVLPHSHRIARPVGPGAALRRGLGVAALALAVCLALLMLPGLLVNLEADYVTGVGETKSLRLEDGSVIHLAADSAVAVAYRENQRRVELLAGEAFFEVAPDQTRPFTVTAEAVEATALGTAFNVRLMPAGTAVAVGEGSVKVALPHASHTERLQPGEWLRVGGPEGAVVRGEMPAGQVGAWRNGQLIVKTWRLSEVAAELDRYHQGAILIIDDAIAQRQVTGVYDLRDPLAALRSAAYPHRGVVRQIAPWLLVVSSR